MSLFAGQPECRHKRAAIASLALACLMVCGSVGCDHGEVKLAPVKGAVTCNGKPLAAARLEFQPDAGPPSFGRTAEDGTYVMQFSGGRAGAVVGQHVVRITTAELDSVADRMTKETLPAKYNTRSTLLVEVTNGENVHDFALTVP